MEDVFEKIRNEVSMKEIADYYGISFDRGGMACCPFHEDKTPSLKLYDDHFYCFGCGEHGDAASFVSRLYGLRQIDAAKMISRDFGLHLFDKEFASPIKKEISEKQIYHEWIKQAIETVSHYISVLCEWRAEFAPHDHNAVPDKLFIESLNNMAYAEYIRDILKFGSYDDRKEMYQNGKDIINKMQERVNLAKGTVIASRSII